MRILHLCLSNFYIDNVGYQENYLVRQNVADGHEVLIIASTETFDGCGGLTYAEPGSYLGSDGAQVIRIPYVKWLPSKIGRKLRVHSGVYSLIDQFGPDAILFHGCSSAEIATVARYARDNPDMLFYADSHADINNSARSFVSRFLLHRLLYRYWLRRALPQIRKILCVNMEAMDFLSKLYGVSHDRLEFFPLGGQVLSEAEIAKRREKTRKELSLSDGNFVFLQSGKMTKRKNLTASLRAFSQTQGDHLSFLIVGLLTDEVRDETSKLIAADPRIQFLGWKSPDELNDLLCAADAYIQPGTQSVTMQNALCCGCPVIIDDVPGHHPYIPSGAVLLQGPSSLNKALIAALGWDKVEKRMQALAFAEARLDYKNLATRFLHPSELISTNLRE